MKKRCHLISLPAKKATSLQWPLGSTLFITICFVDMPRVVFLTGMVQQTVPLRKAVNETIGPLQLCLFCNGWLTSVIYLAGFYP